MQKNISESINILQITDLHIQAESGQKMSGVDTEYSFGQILEHAFAQSALIDLILVTGDLAQHPGKSSYQRILSGLEKYQTRTLCLPGNHDNFELMQQFINTEQVNCDKHLSLKNWHIINLNSKKIDSQGGYLAPDELEYLNSKLSQHSGQNTMIAIHHPPFATGSKWMDTMIIENKDTLFSILEKHPQVKVIICGHIHQELDVKKGGLTIFGTPSTCFQFKPNSISYEVDNTAPGYRLLKLHSNGEIKSEVHRVPLIF